MSNEVIASVVFSDLTKKTYITNCWAYCPDILHAMRKQYVIIRTRRNPKDGFIYHYQQDEVQEEITALRKELKQVGWGLRLIHKSWWGNNYAGEYVAYPLGTDCMYLHRAP